MIVAILLCLLLASCRATEPSSSESAIGPIARADPVPAWLAWMTGGFPDGFRRAVRSVPALSSTAVVAGDTRWMTISRDAAGRIVDRPDRPYRIPIDAFAVDPADYRPFVPETIRDEVVAALERGEAVLGASSARLRRVGRGGSLGFGGVTVDVAMVVPDHVVGWSEVFVNRNVGRRLGISRDRYLLAQADDALTPERFERLIRELLPPDAYLRIEEPGGTEYVRVASGGNPPVVMKRVFGEFAAYPSADDPANLSVDPAWYDEHIVTRSVPILGDVTCHRDLFPALEGALQELVDRGLDHLIEIYSGCYAPRTVARTDTAPPSQHAYGAAIDIDAPTNGYGDPTPSMDQRVVEVFERWGFIWGGDFLVTDGAHFEYRSRPR
jgi:hypothetical protein